MGKFEDYRIADLQFGDGRCRIDWFGAVTFAERYRRSSQPLIEVQLSAIPDELSDVNALFDTAMMTRPQTKQIRLPVSFIPFLKVGDIWKDGRLVDSPEYEIGDFPDLTITRAATSIIKAGLNADEEGEYYLPYQHHPYHMNHTQSYCVMIERAEYKIVIPAMELIRFYFGSSGDLIARIFDVPFESAKFWNVALTGVGGINPKIDLASGISCRSASTVGRIAFSRPAQSAVELIGKSCIAGSANGPKIYPKAVFPFEGKTDLLASGRWLPLKGVEQGVFLVFHLHSCSHPFPFSGLDYTGERKDVPGSKTTFGNDTEANKDTSSTRYNRKIKDSKTVVDAEPDKAKTRRNVDLAGKKRDQFPDLGNKRVIKVDIDFVPTILRTSAGTSIISAASVGDRGKDKTLQPIDFVDAGQASQVAGAANERKLAPAVALFLELAMRLQSSGQFSSVEFVRLDRRQRFDYLCKMPQIVDVDGVVLPWCLAPDTATTTRNRHISIGRAIELYATHYFLIPETNMVADEKPEAIELHLITDGSRSISRTADLLTAFEMHAAQPRVFSEKFQLGRGVSSIKHTIPIPIDLSPMNLEVVSKVMLQLAIRFARPELNLSL